MVAGSDTSTKLDLTNLAVILKEGFLPQAPPTVLAGRTALHKANWSKITTNLWVLETVAGYKLKLIDTQSQSCDPVTVVNREMTDKISLEVKAMLEKGAILPVQDHLNPGFIQESF